MTLPAHASILTGPHAAHARHPRQRLVPPRRRRADAGHRAEAVRLSHRRVRRRLRARRAFRARPRLRRVRRSLSARGGRRDVQLRRAARRGGRQGGGRLDSPSRRRLSPGRPSPWFAWVHLFDPHAPYDAPRGVPRGTLAVRRARSRIPMRCSGGCSTVSSAARALDRTLVVVTADHGESLGDHGETTHGLFAYDSTLAVPLIVSGSGGRPRRRRRAGGARRHPADDRRSARRRAAAESRRPVGRRCACRRPAGLFRSAGREPDARLGAADRRRRRVTGSTSICRCPSSTTCAPIRGEAHNLVEREPARRDALRRALAAARGGAARRRCAGRRGRRRRGAAAVARLHGGVRRAARATGTRAADDPKRLVALNERFNTALEAFNAGRSDEALSRFLALLRERPDFITARTSAATVLMATGARGDAVALLRAAPAAQASAPEILAKLGAALQRSRRPRGAAAAFERSRAAGNQNPELFNDLGVVYAQLGTRGRGARAVSGAAAARPERGRRPGTTSASRNCRRGSSDAAADAFRHAVSADPSNGEAWQGLGAAIVGRDRRRRSTPGAAPSGCGRATTTCCSTSAWCWPTATAPPRRCRISPASCRKRRATATRATSRASRRRSRRHAGDAARLLALRASLASLARHRRSASASACDAGRAPQAAPLSRAGALARRERPARHHRHAARRSRRRLRQPARPDADARSAGGRGPALSTALRARAADAAVARVADDRRRYPTRNGVRDNGTFRLDERSPTLAPALKAAGYRTGAFVGAFVLDARFGLNRGFDVYDDRMLGSSARSRARAAQRRAGARRRRRTGSSTELASPSPPARQPPARGSRGSTSTTRTNRTRRRSRTGRATPPSRTTARSPSPTPRSARSCARLRAAGALEHTLVVVTSDHGESLGEHGERTHGLFAYDATLRVPLVLWAPSRFVPAVFARPTRLVDVAPTVLDLVGAPPLADADGRSVRPFVAGERAVRRSRLVLRSAQRQPDAELGAADRARARPAQADRSAAARALRPRAPTPASSGTCTRRSATARAISKRASIAIARSASPAAPAGVDADAQAACARSATSSASVAPKRTYTAADDPKRLVHLNAALDDARRDVVAGRRRPRDRDASGRSSASGPT